MAKSYKYTNDFSSVGGYNTPQAGMTYTGSGRTYYGNDGFIYNMTDGSRRPGNPPAKAPEPAPPPPTPSAPRPSKPKAPEPEPEAPKPPTPVTDPVTDPEIDDITPPPLGGGLEDTIIAPPPDAPPAQPQQPKGYISNNPSEEGRYLTKKKRRGSRSLYG